ncbi:LicD family protein [bacterium]|nr:LicD family protein [bacterium]
MVNLELEISKDFFEKEIRNNFPVTEERKQIWAVELDLLNKFDSVCKNHSLNYCVGAGTMLGAVRHKGFIPWDDDIDVYMLREDYDRFCLLHEEFKHPYFLQNAYSEPNMLKSFVRLRNSCTTGCTTQDIHKRINKGIFIDIFPIDGVSDNVILDKIQKFEVFWLKKLYSLYNRSRIPLYGSFFSKIFQFAVIVSGKLFIRDRLKLFETGEKVTKRYSKPDTLFWGNRSINFDCPKSRRPLSDYQNVVLMPFEMLEVPVPSNYDAMLSQQYGDYMKIPKNKNENLHGKLIISTECDFDNLMKRAK